jgi:hypothetical protein
LAVLWHLPAMVSRICSKWRAYRNNHTNSHGAISVHEVLRFHWDVLVKLYRPRHRSEIWNCPSIKCGRSIRCPHIHYSADIRKMGWILLGWNYGLQSAHSSMAEWKFRRAFRPLCLVSRSALAYGPTNIVQRLESSTTIR